MSDIVLAALNARYAHCSMGLRCLKANLAELEPRAEIIEFTLSARIPEMVERILSSNPRIVGIGVYVWNAPQCLSLVGELKRLRPGLTLVLGGPEVSHETLEQEISRVADFVITGEGEVAFAALCRQILSGSAPAGKIITASPPDLGLLELPYRLYTDDDIANRVVYAEGSRGCPFACDFCLSSLDSAVRAFPLEPLFEAWSALFKRGARRFKFVDRTFNMDIGAALAILDFFLKRADDSLFLHFETVPDRFPEELYTLIKKFPPGTVQLEIGVQTFSGEVAARISRRQDCALTEINILRLRRETGAYLHADLIAGLPGEGLTQFAAGFDRLFALGPHEIQVGILKRLRGAPIARHDKEWGMIYSPCPPYELRENSLLDFFTMQRLRRFARYWDLVVSSGVFAGAARLICGGTAPFQSFMDFSDWLYAQTGQTHEISRSRLRELLRDYLCRILGNPAAIVAEIIERDAVNSGRDLRGAGPKRQARLCGQGGFVY